MKIRSISIFLIVLLVVLAINPTKAEAFSLMEFFNKIFGFNKKVTTNSITLKNLDYLKNPPEVLGTSTENILSERDVQNMIDNSIDKIYKSVSSKSTSTNFLLQPILNYYTTNRYSSQGAVDASNRSITSSVNSSFSSLQNNGVFTGNSNFDTGTLYIDSVNRRVGVATTSPAQKFSVQGTSQFNGSIYAGSDASSISNYLSVNGGVADVFIKGHSSGDESVNNPRYGLLVVKTDRATDGDYTNRREITGGKFDVYNTGDEGEYTIKGIDVSAKNQGYTYGDVIGAYITASTDVDTYLDNAYGVSSNISVPNGYITNGYGYYSKITILDSVPMNSGYGLYVDSPTGKIINNYGVYIADQTVSGALSNYQFYNLYSAGTARNYFGGNVGIATTSPWVSLGVNGRVATPALRNDSTGYYVCLRTTTGELSTSTTACGASSIKYKENIIPITYGLKDVLNLNPVSFNYKSGYSNEKNKQLGFIAEEVASVTPELVAYDSNGEIQGLDYPKFSSVLVKAVQELNKKFDDMFSDIGKTLNEYLSNNNVNLKSAVADKFEVQGDFRVNGNICVDDTCITKDQFKDMILRSGVGALQYVNIDQNFASTTTQASSTNTQVSTTTATTTSNISNDNQ